VIVPGLPTGAKLSAFQSTAILRMPMPRNPPKSMMAAWIWPSRLTMTYPELWKRGFRENFRPIAHSQAVAPASRPRHCWHHAIPPVGMDTTRLVFGSVDDEVA
jgi:hypothetical protein